MNILQATFFAMKEAVKKLFLIPDYLLFDGHLFPQMNIPSKAIVKGDSLSLSIAVASIIAKRTRDEMMREYDRLWPEYGFAKHKGYGTQFHRDRIKIHGPCPLHRKTFEPIKSMLSSSELIK